MEETVMQAATAAENTQKVQGETETKASAKKPKTLTPLKAAQTALNKLESELKKKAETIEKLTAEKEELEQKIAESKAQIEKMEAEETLNKLEDALFREDPRRVSSKQLMAALDIVQQLNGDLDKFEIHEVVALIQTAAKEKAQTENKE
jgi:predicted RNase H-like nuclease (RuvC/YqgF family)